MTRDQDLGKQSRPGNSQKTGSLHAHVPATAIGATEQLAPISEGRSAVRNMQLKL
jgi:hypothetical protein